MYITNIKMKLLELNIKRLDKKIKRNEKKIIRRLQKSYRDVKHAIIHQLEGDRVYTRNNRIFTISQETGECTDYLVYIPEYNTIHRIKYYLDAYLTTNRDVLEESEIGELEGLLRYFH